MTYQQADSIGRVYRDILCCHQFTPPETHRCRSVIADRVRPTSGKHFVDLSVFFVHLLQHLRSVLQLDFAVLRPMSTVHPKDVKNFEPLEQAQEVSLPDLVAYEDGEIWKAHHFSDFANWLVPGRVLVGEYPGCKSPYRSSDEESNGHRVRDIVVRGEVTEILCLQGEIPAQDDESQWKESANGQLSCNGFYGYRNDAIAAARETGLNHDGVPSFHYFPISDFRPAESLELMADAVDRMARLVKSGKTLYIHCRAGRGRSGLFGACLLGRLYADMTAEDALNRIDTCFRTRMYSDGDRFQAFLQEILASGDRRRSSPETNGQEDQVRLFFQDMLRR